MKCYICDSQDFEHLQDLGTEKPLLVCKVCGNICYQVEPEDEKRLLDFYRREYRQEPGVQNLITSTHKLAYVKVFMDEYLKDKKGLVCGDIGSAIGYIPNYLRRMGHKATGCELTVTFRRFCEHFYGIPLTEELQEVKGGYDLLTMYHVLEHLIEPDKKLAKYVSMLKDDGRMMISTPEWLDVLEEASGTQMDSFKHLFHVNHINVFTAQSLKNLFGKCGLVIEKEDHITYGQTYLLRKMTAEEKATWAMVNEPWQEQAAKVRACKKAIELYTGSRDELRRLVRPEMIKEAIALWPKFPEAHVANIVEVNMKTKERQEELWPEALKVLGNSSRVRLSYGIWLYQQARYDEALREFEWFMQYKPNEDVLMYIGWSLFHTRKFRDAMNAFNNASAMNPMKWNEATQWIAHCCGQMMAWDERAMVELQKSVMAKPELQPRPKDPMMDDLVVVRKAEPIKPEVV